MTIGSVIKHIRNGTFRQRTKEKLHEIIGGGIRHFREWFPIKKNKIVFDNFGGRGFADHPRYIAEEIHRRGLKWDIVWLVNDMNEPMPDWVRKVRFRSWQSVYELTTAKFWVDNIRNAHLVPKKDGQIYLQTWHGSMAMKLIEKETEHNLSHQYVKCAKYDGKIIDAIISCNKIQSNRFKNSFWLQKNTEILEYGGPRYDCLFEQDYLIQTRQKVRKFLGIKQEDYVILYAPTYREDGNTKPFIFDYKKIINAFNEKTRLKCRLLIRMHPNVSKQGIIEFDDDIIDGSKIPDSNDAIICSDILLTDFSSMLYEASLLGKVSFRLATDYEEYVKTRPLLKIEEDMPFLISKNIDQLIEQIVTTDYADYIKKIEQFIKTISSFDQGVASIKTVDWILSNI